MVTIFPSLKDRRQLCNGGYDSIMVVCLVTVPNVMLQKCSYLSQVQLRIGGVGGFEPLLYPQPNVSCAPVLHTCTQQ